MNVTPKCMKHDVVLSGHLEVVKVTNDEWALDTSNMWCTSDPDDTSGCNQTWTVEAQ